MKLVIALLIIFFSQTKVAHAEIITLQSRNMPTHCEYVFEVFSDLLIQVETPLAEVTGVLVSFQNEYTHEWSQPIHLTVEANQKTAIAKTSFKSMSTNPKYLLRKLRFAVLPKQATSANSWLYSEFGRTFGEPCYPVSSATPFRVRQITSTPL